MNLTWIISIPTNLSWEVFHLKWARKLGVTNLAGVLKVLKAAALRRVLGRFLLGRFAKLTKKKRLVELNIKIGRWWFLDMFLKMENMENLDDVKDYLKKGVSWKNAGFFSHFTPQKKLLMFRSENPWNCWGNQTFLETSPLRWRFCFKS